MKRKTLRERQQKIAAREEKRAERLKAKGLYNEQEAANEEAANAEIADSEAEAIAPAEDKADETMAAMQELAEKFGIKQEEPAVEVPYTEDEAEEEEFEDNTVEISAFDNFRKKRGGEGYESRDNGRLFKFYNLNLGLRILALVAVIIYAVFYHEQFLAGIYSKPWEGFDITMLLWLFLVVAIIARFIPGIIKNPGYQKQFIKYYVPTPNYDEEILCIKHRIKRANQGAWKVLALWVAVNAVVGLLYFGGIIDETVLVIIAVFYAVADVVCILYYCPFQHLLMKNRCCMTCRIYNWDFLMICTPLIFIKSWLTWSLVLIALIVLIRWEYVYKHHPERFFGATNSKLRCVNCSSKLCRAKYPATPTAKQLFNRK